MNNIEGLLITLSSEKSDGLVARSDGVVARSSIPMDGSSQARCWLGLPSLWRTTLCFSCCYIRRAPGKGASHQPSPRHGGWQLFKAAFIIVLPGCTIAPLLELGTVKVTSVVLHW